jgi:hypothetical protein
MKAPILVCLTLALAACSKQEPPAPAEPTPSAPPPIAATVEPPAPSATAAAEPSEPATEEDFEEEAAQQVTAPTLDAQLDALEKEISAD